MSYGGQLEVTDIWTLTLKSSKILEQMSLKSIMAGDIWKLLSRLPFFGAKLGGIKHFLKSKVLLFFSEQTTDPDGNGAASAEISAQPETSSEPELSESDSTQTETETTTSAAAAAGEGGAATEKDSNPSEGSLTDSEGSSSSADEKADDTDEVVASRAVIDRIFLFFYNF